MDDRPGREEMLKETAYGVSASSYSRPVTLAESSAIFATSSLFPTGTVFEDQRRLAQRGQRPNTVAASVAYASSPPENVRMPLGHAQSHEGTEATGTNVQSMAILDFSSACATGAISGTRAAAASRADGGEPIPALGTLSLSARVYLRLCLGLSLLPPPLSLALPPSLSLGARVCLRLRLGVSGMDLPTCRAWVWDLARARVCRLAQVAQGFLI
jgi:hypothetical protein